MFSNDMALVFIHPPWFTDTWIPKEGALPPNPTSCTPVSTSAGLGGGRTQIELCQSLVWVAEPKPQSSWDTWASSASTREQWASASAGTLLPAGRSARSPRISGTIIFKCKYKKSFWLEHKWFSLPCCISLLPLFISSDNWAMNLHVLK